MEQAVILEILKVVVWPITILAAIWLLRDPLRLLVPSTRTVKYKDLQIEFGRDVEKVKEEAKAELPAPPVRALPEPTMEDRLLLMAEVSPNGAILEAWRELERASLQVLTSRGTQVPSSVAARYKMIERLLENSGVLEPKKVKIFSDLRQLRNRVAHAHGVDATPDQALEFIEIALGLITALKDAKAGSAPSRVSGGAA